VQRQRGSARRLPADVPVPRHAELMHRLLVAVMLLAACRGGKHPRVRNDAGHDVPASVVSAVPKLPISRDGARALTELDNEVEAMRDVPLRVVPLLLARAGIR